MVGDIVSVARFLFDSISGIKKASLEKREKIAKYCEDISSCLEKIVVNHNENKSSPSQCSELQYYADTFADTVTGVIEYPQSKELAQGLVNAQHSRAMMHITRGHHNIATEEFTAEISEAAGLFRAVANTVRAQ